jgi:nitrite reductase/ring-hydroxylating ferredoxin subunit
MAEALPLADSVDERLPLCASTDLAERGRAWVWDVVQWRQPARAFALRFDGQLKAYLNRCSSRAHRDGLAARRVPRHGQALDPVFDPRRDV